MESDIDKMELKRNKLLKVMESKANEADVRTYKNIYSEIEQIEKEVTQRKKHIFSMKKNIEENSKYLYKGIIEIQEEYSDILSETVPNLWVQEFS